MGLFRGPFLERPGTFSHPKNQEALDLLSYLFQQVLPGLSRNGPQGLKEICRDMQCHCLTLCLRPIHLRNVERNAFFGNKAECKHIAGTNNYVISAKLAPSLWNHQISEMGAKKRLSYYFTILQDISY